MTYSVIRFEGSIQSVVDEGLSLSDAANRAHKDTWGTGRETDHITAVINEDDDSVVWGHIYQNGRHLNRSTVNSIVYGLGRFM